MASISDFDRLSEDSNITVGVIEAGDYHVGIPGIDVPGMNAKLRTFVTDDRDKTSGMMGQLIADPSYDWTFLSVPQESANGRVILQPRGKGLGGSSLVSKVLSKRSTTIVFTVI